MQSKHVLFSFLLPVSIYLLLLILMVLCAFRWLSIGKWGLDCVGVMWGELTIRSLERSMEDGCYWFAQNYRNCSNISLLSKVRYISQISLVALGTKPRDSWAKPLLTQGTDILERPERIFWRGWEKSGNLLFYSMAHKRSGHVVS